MGRQLEARFAVIDGHESIQPPRLAGGPSGEICLGAIGQRLVASLAKGLLEGSECDGQVRLRSRNQAGGFELLVEKAQHKRRVTRTEQPDCWAAFKVRHNPLKLHGPRSSLPVCLLAATVAGVCQALVPRLPLTIHCYR